MTAVNPSTPRPSVIQLAIKEKAALYAAYIPLFEDGGHPVGQRVEVVNAVLPIPEGKRHPLTHVARPSR